MRAAFFCIVTLLVGCSDDATSGQSSGTPASTGSPGGVDAPPGQPVPGAPGASTETSNADAGGSDASKSSAMFCTTNTQHGICWCDDWAQDQCKGGTAVTFCTVRDGGHTWPGPVDSPPLGKTTKDINANDALWDFFKAHPIP